MTATNQTTPEEINKTMEELDKIDFTQAEASEQEEQTEETNQEQHDDTQNLSEQEEQHDEEQCNDDEGDEDGEDAKEDEQASKKKEQVTETKGIDYRKRYSDSEREGQILYAQNQEILDTIEQSASIPEPTEEQLKATYSAWEEMTDTERMLAKDNLWNKLRLEKINSVAEKKKQRDEWAIKVTEYVKDETVINQLKGRTNDFIKFATMPTKVGFPNMEDLVNLFSYEQSKQEPQRKSLPFNNQGGQREKKVQAYTETDAKKLRTMDFRKYKEMIDNKKLNLVDQL